MASAFYMLRNYFGHLLPGTFYLLWSFWVAFNIFQRYYAALAHSALNLHSKKEHYSSREPSSEDDEEEIDDKKSTRKTLKKRYTNSLHFPTPLWPARPIDAMFRAHLTGMWMIRSLLHAYNGSPDELHPQQTHYTIRALNHAATYFGFFCAFAVEAATYKQWAPRAARLLPRNADYYALVLALVNQSIIFVMHIPQQSGISVRLHELHVIILGCMSIVTVFECAGGRHLIGAALGRAYFMLLQALWLYFEDTVMEPQVYGGWFPTWKVNTTNDERMMVVAIFVGLCMLALGMLLALHVVVVVFLRLKYGEEKWNKMMDFKEEYVLMENMDGIYYHGGGGDGKRQKRNRLTAEDDRQPLMSE